jgi:hypothetical protein
MNGLLAAAIVLAWLIAAPALRRGDAASALRRGATVGTWDCGYAAPDARMQYTGSSVGDSLAALFPASLRPRRKLPRVKNAFPAPSEFRSRLDDPVLDGALLPLARKVDERIAWFRRFQQGVIQNYLLYIFITVAVLLAALLPFKQILALLEPK